MVVTNGNSPGCDLQIGDNKIEKVYKFKYKEKILLQTTDGKCNA